MVRTDLKDSLRRLTFKQSQNLPKWNDQHELHTQHVNNNNNNKRKDKRDQRRWCIATQINEFESSKKLTRHLGRLLRVFVGHAKQLFGINKLAERFEIR